MPLPQLHNCLSTDLSVHESLVLLLSSGTFVGTGTTPTIPGVDRVLYKDTTIQNSLHVHTNRECIYTHAESRRPLTNPHKLQAGEWLLHDMTLQ